MRNVNLGCGPVYVDSPEWLNFDYAPTSRAVRRANLLGRLPVPDGVADLVYASHFLEHVPRERVSAVLMECWRVLRPGGVVRLVVPDLENMAREYLAKRDSGEHEKADFVVLEMIDQCVRREPGGEPGLFYRQVAGRSDEGGAAMMDYIRVRTGEDLRINPVSAGAGLCSIASHRRYGHAPSGLGCAFVCGHCRGHFACRMSAWLAWASDTYGYGISISSKVRWRPSVSLPFNASVRRPARWRISPSTRWTSMLTGSHARGRNRFTWRRASHANAGLHGSEAVGGPR